MNQNQCIVLIQSLNKSEIRAFRKFLRSAYFSTRTDFPVLFETILQQLNRKKGLDKANLFRKAYPTQAFHDLKLRAAISDLKEMLEEFLTIRHFNQDRIRREMALLELYAERKLPGLFKQKFSKVQQLLDRAADQALDIWQYQLRLQRLEMEHLAQQKRTADLPLQSISDHLDANFILAKLEHACTQLSHQLVYKTQYDFGLLKEVLVQVESGKFMDRAAIAIYYYCFRFLSQAEDKSSFDNFRDLLLGADHPFPDKMLKDLYLLGLNFCIRQSNQGNTYFMQEAWLLYQRGLEAGVFLENNRLSRFTFNNIIGMGINLEAFAWLEHFIVDYQTYLDPADRDSIVYFARARLAYFAQKDYDQVIDLLQKVAFRDIVDNLIAKNMLSRVYFELGELDLLEAHLNSFQQYIRRGKIGRYHKSNYNNIIRLTRKLLGLAAYAPEKRAMLIREIEQTEILTERRWLLEQLQEKPPSTKSDKPNFDG